MLPPERRQVGQQVVRHCLRLAKHGDGAFEVARVPQDDGGDEQAQPGRPVLLVLVGTVAYLAQPVDEDRGG